MYRFTTTTTFIWHSLQEMVVSALQHLTGVESIVLLHLLFHEVAHDAGIESLTSRLIWHMILFWVI